MISNLVITHWNCNSIKRHKLEILNLTAKNQHFICINETKLSTSDSITFSNYEIIRKDRNRSGGGVAILARNDMQFESVSELDKFSLELVAIKVKLKTEFFYLISLYIPPRKNSQDKYLDAEFFNTLNKLQPFILCGDLNSKSKLWNCKDYNSNGRTLEELIINSNFSIINNRSPTHKDPAHGSESVIDLFITSANLISKLLKCYVKSSDTLSGHFPVVASFNMPTSRSSGRIVLYKKVIDWDAYKNHFLLELQKHYNWDFTPKNEPDTVDTDYNLTVQTITEATNAATTLTTRVHQHKTVPAYLLDLIKARKKSIRSIKYSKPEDPLLPSKRAHYNKLSNIIKQEMKAIQESQWTSFCQSIKETQKYSADYWKKIKQISTQSSTPSKPKPIPNLFYRASVISTDAMKAQIFGEILCETFRDSNEPNFDQLHKVNTEQYLEEHHNELFNSSTENNNLSIDDQFGSNDLDECLETVIKKSAPGPDGISNLQILNLPSTGKSLILKMANSSWKEGRVIEAWKLAKVLMIEKKATDQKIMRKNCSFIEQSLDSLDKLPICK